jgi:hypothetical protein
VETLQSVLYESTVSKVAPNVALSAELVPPGEQCLICINDFNDFSDFNDFNDFSDFNDLFTTRLRNGCQSER